MDISNATTEYRYNRFSMETELEIELTKLTNSKVLPVWFFFGGERE